MRLTTKHPAVILAVLGAVSGILCALSLSFNFGTYSLDLITGVSLHLALYMIPAGVLFGLVTGFGVWRWGNRSWVAAAIALAGTWIAWEMAANLAIQIYEHWLWRVVPEETRMYISGFAAGALGALVTWAGAASLTPALRQVSTMAAITVTGALFGLLLPLSNHYSAVLFVPWQTAVAATLGLGLARQHERLS